MIDKDLYDALRIFGSRNVQTFPASVLSVNKEDGTCSVNDGDLDHPNVALSASVEDGGKRFYMFPKIGSFVLVSPVNEDIHRLYVEFFSEIEDFDLKIESTQLEMDKDGFLLKKENETLKILMQDLITAIRAMVFQTNTGITVKLLNDVQFQQIEERFNQFLK